MNPFRSIERQGRKPVRLQDVDGHPAAVWRNPRTGEVAIQVWPAGSRIETEADLEHRSEIIPLAIARLMAGRHAWVQQIDIRCPECGTRNPLGELDSEQGLCDRCFNAEVEEVV